MVREALVQAHAFHHCLSNLSHARGMVTHLLISSNALQPSMTMVWSFTAGHCEISTLKSILHIGSARFLLY